jgi:serine/threonine protein kinase/tetratricopeptide (TPR) repeat protein
MAESLLTKAMISHYRIVSRLGAGGMGEVYLAQDTKLDRKVALKILPAEVAANQERMRRFIQEAKAAGALSHPNIAQIFEIGEHEGTHFIAMEFVDGVTLREVIHSSQIDVLKLLRYLQHTAEGLAKAHAAGIVHRDLKPDNIMITRDGHAKILDFGLAKLIEPSGQKPGREGGRKNAEASEMATAILQQHSTPGVVLGTVGYMSPEQAQGRTNEIDGRSDIFSFGCILYETVTAHKAFEGKDTIDTLNKIIREPVGPLSDFRPDAPNHLQRIVRRCLAKDPDERYQTIKDIALELRDLRRELAGSAGIDTTVSPNTAASTLGSAGSTPTVPSDATRAATASSAEYIVSGIKQHKLAAVVVAIALVVGAVGLGMYLHARSTEVPIDSIAVLPFANTNADPNTDFLSDGITESIISSLSQLSQLKVMARSTVFQYKGKDVDPRKVGHDLGVRAVLMGRLIQQGDNLTIRTELVNVSDGTELWGQQYNRKLADLFAVQEEIAKEISDKLRLKLSGADIQQLAKRPTENLKAFQYYTQARSYAERRTREDLLTAIRYCENAIGEDPNYALAYTELAEAYTQLGIRSYIAPLEGRRKAEESSRKALALDENLAEAHVAVGFRLISFSPYDFVQGDRELRRAIELSPSLARAHQQLGVSLVRRGHSDEALAEVLKARELDPLSSIIARQLALPYYFKRDHIRALELLRQANELGPAFTTPWEIGVYIQSGKFDEALAELEKAKRERKSDPLLIYSTGMVYAAQGKRAEALQIIKELEGMSGANLDQAHWIAKIYAALNEKDLAFSWLERGLAAGAIAIFFKDEPVWDPLRTDPRFADFLRRMGFPQ